MKKKLLIIVGAGASIDFGLPSVNDVNALFEGTAKAAFSLSRNSNSNLYCYFCEKLNRYYKVSSKPHLSKKANFEEVLYQINLLIPHISDPQRHHGANALLKALYLPKVSWNGLQQKSTDGSVLSNLAETLMDALVDHFIDACEKSILEKRKELTQLGNFLTTLQDEFEIGIITLNYDNIFTQLDPNLYTGFDETGKFSPISVFQRTSWNFIYHLHGSVHFAMTGNAHDLHGITWNPTPAKNHSVHASGRNTQNYIEGIDYPTSPFVAGYGKNQQILRQPFRTYFSQTNRLVHEADSLLFLGYGFGDQHLNSAFSEVRNRYRPIVVVDYANNEKDPLLYRSDEWSYNLFATLPGNSSDMGSKKYSCPANISELRATHEMEISKNKKYPLSIWYNGMLEACNYSQKILEYLKSK